LVAGQRVRRAVKSALFCAVLVGLLALAEFIMKPGVGETVPWAGLSSSRGEVDVITLGSSHAHCAILPMELWREAGITAANVTGPSQPMPTTLAFLQQALKTENPKVVLLETCLIDRPEPLSYRSKANFDPMPWGVPKVLGIVRAAPVEQWEFLFVPLLSYHDRWDQIGRGDFNPEKYARFSFMRGGLYVVEAEALDEVPQRRNISEDGYQRDLSYVREIARLCEQGDIDLILFNAPPADPVLPSGEMLLDRLEADLSGEFTDITYLDLNDHVEDLGLDPALHYKDSSHVNGLGGARISAWLARALQVDYGVPDRRSEPLARHWNEDLLRYDAYVRTLIEAGTE